MALLITGGAGYIGSHTCVELLNSGEDIVVTDNFFNSDPSVLDAVKRITGKDFKIYEADMLDMPAVDKIFDENDIEQVIHCAGYKCAAESIKRPLRYYSNNLRGTFNVLETMKKYGCTKFIFSSSATVYGVRHDSRITEGFPMAAANPYATTKMVIENLMNETQKSSRTWTMISLRYYQPLGAHSSGLIGNRTLLGDLSGLAEIVGNDYPPCDESCVGDYVHVVDLAKAHAAAVKKAREMDGGYRAYNLGLGRACSDHELAGIFKKISGKDFVDGADDSTDVFLDTSLAEKELGWRAELSIEDMCRDAWNYVQTHK